MCLVNRPCFLNCEYQLFVHTKTPRLITRCGPLRMVEFSCIAHQQIHIILQKYHYYLSTYLPIYLSTYLSIYTNHYKSLHLLSHFFPLHPHLNLSKITVRFAWLNPPVFGALQLQYLLQPPLTSSIYPLVI